MNKLISVLFILIVIVSIISACTNGKNAKECTKPLNPNGDSKLAILMRKMADNLEQEKTLILNQKIKGEYPTEFEKIYSANPSSPNAKSENFNEYAHLYLQELKKYCQSDSFNRVLAFNNLVNSCIACHQNECPGPIQRIEKNLIN